MDDELVQRFLNRETKNSEQDPTSPFLLSRDRTLGLLKNPDHSSFMSLGKYKLKKPRLHGKPVHILGLYFYPELLYRAMYIFHRRRRFELGLYQLSTDEVFAIREGDDIILIAPVIFSDSAREYFEFKDLVEQVSKSFFERWKAWRRILQGKKDS